MTPGVKVMRSNIVKPSRSGFYQPPSRRSSPFNMYCAIRAGIVEFRKSAPFYNPY
jgi:hypothetical protein